MTYDKNNIFAKILRGEIPCKKIYENEYCLSPIPSLTMHCTNINSVYGLPPNFRWKKIWEENEN